MRTRTPTWSPPFPVGRRSPEDRRRGRWHLDPGEPRAGVDDQEGEGPFWAILLGGSTNDRVKRVGTAVKPLYIYIYIYTIFGRLLNVTGCVFTAFAPNSKQWSWFGPYLNYQSLSSGL